MEIALCKAGHCINRFIDEDNFRSVRERHIGTSIADMVSEVVVGCLLLYECHRRIRRALLCIAEDMIRSG